MRLPAPKHPVARGLAILLSGCGLGLILGVMWPQTDSFKILFGFALAALGFVVMVFTDIGVL